MTTVHAPHSHFSAPFLDACQGEVVAKHIEQGASWLSHDFMILPIDRE